MTAVNVRWKEYSWKAPDKDWPKAKVITAGVDVGSVSSQALVLTDNEIFCYSSVYTGSSSPDSAHKAMKMALEGTDMKLKDIQFAVGTGYGRINVPFANKTVTEISCHARGANRLLPTVRTILDMGGQDCKAIRCDERGKVTQFVMNDKCAAGSGRSMEVLGELLSVPVEDIGPRSLDIEGEPPRVSSTCVVFAKSEALSLLRSGVPTNEVIAAYCDALAHRVHTLVSRVGMEEDFMISGGIAKNIGVVRRLEKLFDVKAHISFEPQIIGALGAAIFANDLLEKSTKS